MDGIKSLWKKVTSEGAIFLQDGQTTCKNVCCSRGTVVKELIDRVSVELGIAPIARPFFALCDPNNCIPLNPYHSLSHDEAKKAYQLRVFVNTGENSLQFMKISKQTYQYYYQQLKEDFIADRLYPRTTVNTALFLAAIDIARAAHEHSLDYENIVVSSKDLNKYMPKFLKEKLKKDDAMEKKLRDTFSRFKEIRNELQGLEHYEAKYMEVYEKDMMCGRHIFRIKSNEPKPKKNMTLLLVLSWKEGVQQVWAGEASDKVEKRQEMVCSVRSISSIHVDNLTVTLSLKDDSSDAEQQEKRVLNFCDKMESHSFAVIAQTYYQIMVDANAIIVTGPLAPAEEFLKVGKNASDGLKSQLCHAPIPPYYVSNMLNKNGMMSDGNFLIRESRNQQSAYTLSLCFQGLVMSYRIVYDPKEGYLFQDPNNKDNDAESHKMFKTMMELIEYHKQCKEGLPAVLRMNYAPDVTGPIPLLKVQERTPSRGSLNSAGNPSFPTRIDTPPFNDRASTSSSTGSPQSSASSTYTSTCDPHHPVPFPAGHSGTVAATTPTDTPTSISQPPITPGSIDGDASQAAESPYIRDLIEKGVKFFRYTDLITRKELGHGHYSTVYLAELGTSSDVKKVAVKIPTMKDTNVQEVKHDLKREILTMNSLNHPHIVKLLGISETKHYLDFIGTIPVMIMEFVNGGCLRSNLNKLDRTTLSRDPPRHKKIIENFLLYGKQIADGMSYLEHRKVIHRDLATRNVLMVSEKHVQISDFGLAREKMEESDYYKSKATTDLPIYWYSPECIETFKFSTKGDVWSYGVTLWEIFTIGDKPSKILSTVRMNGASPYQALVQWYKKGNKLAGLNCDTNVYKIMTQCWNLVPSARPTFDELSKQMHDLHIIVSQRNASKTAGPTPSTGSTSSAGSAASSGVTSPQTPQGINFFASSSMVTASSPVTPINSMPPPLGGSHTSVGGNKPSTPTSSIVTASSSRLGTGFPGPFQQPVNGFSAIPSIVGNSSNSGGNSSSSSSGNGSANHTSFPASHSQWAGSPLAAKPPVVLNTYS